LKGGIIFIEEHPLRGSWINWLNYKLEEWSIEKVTIKQWRKWNPTLL